jgi:hypothetical protein
MAMAPPIQLYDCVGGRSGSVMNYILQIYFRASDDTALEQLSNAAASGHAQTREIAVAANSIH